MSPYSRVNKGFKYILNVINCFSKKAFARPLKTKSAKDVTMGMEEILKEIGTPIDHIQSDDGKEFFNALFKDLMNKYNINHYSTYSDLKASIVERFNRTIKSRMFLFFFKRKLYMVRHIARFN